jgi:hypothetical protein
LHSLCAKSGNFIARVQNASFEVVVVAVAVVVVVANNFSGRDT